MTVISVTEAARSGHSQEFIGVDGTGYGRSYHRTFYAETDDPADSVLHVTISAEAIALGMPQLHDTWAMGTEFDNSSIVVNVNPIRHPQNRQFWTVDIEYDYAPGFQVGGEGESTIEKIIPDVRFFFVSYRKKVYRNRDGDPLLTSAKVPFEPPLQIEGQRLALQITQNELVYDPAVAVSFENATNSDVVFGGITVDQAKMAPYAAHRQVIQNELWWSVEYNMQFSREGWALEILDQGFHKLNTNWSPSDPADERTLHITDGGGLPVTRKVLLKDGQPTTPDNPSYLTEDIYQQRAYSALNLPPLVFSLTPST